MAGATIQAQGWSVVPSACCGPYPWDNTHKDVSPCLRRPPHVAAPPSASVVVECQPLDSLHHFWSCPVAVALLTDIIRCLPSSLRPVLRHHLWPTQRFSRCP